MNAIAQPGLIGASYELSVTRFVTRPNDLDSLGHVNNAIVLEYLEAGRWDWFARNGLRRAGDVTPVVARAEVDYRQEIFPGELTITTQLLTDREALAYRATFQQTIAIQQRGIEVIAIEARIDTAFLEMATRRLCALQDFFEANNIPASTLATIDGFTPKEAR